MGDALPPGVTLLGEGSDRCVIVCRPVGRVWQRLGFALWLAGWAGLVGLFTLVQLGILPTQGRPPGWGILTLAWAVVIVVGSLAANEYWTKRIVSLGPDDFRLELVTFGLRRTRNLDRKSVRAVRRVENLSFATHAYRGVGMRVEAESGVVDVLFRDTAERCDWVGRRIAGWANVEFHSEPGK